MATRGDSVPGAPVTRADAERAIAEAARVLPGAVDPTLVGPDVAAMKPYPPGKPLEDVAAEIGLPVSEILRLHANENVLGPSERATEAARAALAQVCYYPDGGITALRRALADRHDTTPDHIAVGAGSNEIIELLVRTFVGPGETVVTAWPSFVVYRLVAQAAGRECLIAPLKSDRYDLSAIAALVDRRTKLVFIANPNNPTGTYVPRRLLASFLDRIPRSVIVVIDEAYFEYASAEDYPNAIQEFRGRPRLVVLRTFSKIYGLAGLRIGYGVMDPTLVHYINCVRQPYNVSSVAQAAALAALGDEEHVRRSQRMVRDGRLDLAQKLEAMGLQVVPSQANFVVVRFPQREADPIARGLRQRGILVRDMGGYDMPSTVRITVGTPPMNARIVDALRDISAGRAPRGAGGST
jgi:histidinol-phosphate aminotransferase